MKKIKYGIMGCGKHALQTHAIPAKEIKELELKAVYDISQEQMDNFEKSYGRKLSKYSDRLSFLEIPLDAVLISTPDEFHFQDLKAVIDSEKHVFIEKPLVSTIQELGKLKDLLKDAKRKDLIVSSCHLRRFDPPFLWLKNNIYSFLYDFGRVESFYFDFSYHKPSKKWKHNRSLLLDHVNHEIDLLHFLLGYESFKATRIKDSFDEYHVAGLRADKTSFEFKGTRRLDSRNYLEFVSIRFERGRLDLETHKGYATIHDHEKDEVYTKRVRPTDYELRGKMTMIDFVKAINKVSLCYLAQHDLYINTSTAVNLAEKGKLELKIKK